MSTSADQITVLRGGSAGTRDAYPVLELGFEERADRLADYLDSFANLHQLGRNARFAYAHLHDLFDDASRLALSLCPA